MLLKELIDGIMIGFAVSIPLGPIGVLCIQKTLNKGRWHGFASGLGAAVSDTIYAIIAGFSLSIVIDFIEERKMLLQIIGSLVLMGFGFTIFFSNPVTQLRKQRSGKVNYFQDFAATFALTISNPLVIFVFIGVFAGLNVMDDIASIYDTIAIVTGVFLGASTWWFTLTGIANMLRDKFNLRRLWWVNKIAGAIIIILAAASSFYVVWQLLNQLGVV